MADVQAEITQVGSSLDTMWILIAAFLVFFMQAGFALLEAGAIRAKNTQNILLKNLLDIGCAAISFYLLGYGFAFGEASGAGNSDPFIGDADFVLASRGFDSWGFYQFQFSFAATAATIVSGSVAERTQMRAYFAYSSLLTMFVYPVVVHWGWTSSGWLSKLGYVDFAGSGIVHMVGGVSGLIGAIALGPRIGRFNEDGSANEIRGHSMALYATGVLILFFGWFGFNGGSTLGANGAMVLAGKVCVNTTLAAASAMLSSLAVAYFTINHLSLMYALNGILAGLVSITAGCATVEPPGAIILGLLGGLLLAGTSRLILKLGIDDPLDAFAVHGACGIWGVVATGLFSSREGMLLAGYFEMPEDGNVSTLTDYGLFYGGHVRMLGVQLLGTVAITVWSTLWAAILFFGFNAVGWLRVKAQDEITGLDEKHHGGAAYATGVAPEALGVQQVQMQERPRRRASRNRGPYLYDQRY